MNKVSQFVTTVSIGVFAVALMGMVFTAAGRAASPVHGSLAQKLTAIAAENLHATALSPADVYGEDWRSALIVCPGTKAEAISAGLSINAADLGIEGTVGDNENYLLVRNVAGQTYAERLNREEVDLCPTNQIPSFDARQMIPLLKTDKGGWTLAG